MVSLSEVKYCGEFAFYSASAERIDVVSWCYRLKLWFLLFHNLRRDWYRFQCRHAGMNVSGRENTRYNMQIGFYVQRAAFEESSTMLS